MINWIRPRAAAGTFPYAHRTVAQVEADFDEAERLEKLNPRCSAALPAVAEMVVGGTLSPLPPAPCLRCGGRGWCGHNGRVRT